MRRAVIDVGSNSVLLLIAEFDNGLWLPISESSEVTGLGEGTKATGLLGEPGMKATLDAVLRAFETARAQAADIIVAAATMAARIASNTSEFLQRAEKQGTPIRVLSGEDEAEFGFQAVANDRWLTASASSDSLAMIDVGGHSTEVVTAKNEGSSWNVTFRKSFPVGTLALRSGILSAESPDGGALMLATTELDNALELPQDFHGAAIALGATGTNLITIREKMTAWDADLVHGEWLDYEEVSRAVGWMSPMTDDERAAIVGIEKGRERTIHIGSLILERVLYALKVEGCYVSVRGWRHALLESLPSS